MSSESERSPKRQKVSDSKKNNVGDLLQQFSEIEEELERAKEKEKDYGKRLEDAEMKLDRASKEEADVYHKYKKHVQKQTKYHQFVRI